VQHGRTQDDRLREVGADIGKTGVRGGRDGRLPRMIASEEYGFAFIHIPKNAGSSLRDQLMDVDDFESAFYKTKQHPELGFYDSSHVPLARLRKHFPDAFEKVSRLTTYTIVREPADRFLSAIAQRARQFHHQLPDTLDEATIRDEVDKAIASIDKESFPPREFVHFSRQSDFIYLDGEQFVDNVYPIEAFDRLVTEIERHLGRKLISGFHANRTVTFRHPALADILVRSKNLAKEHLPIRQYNWLRDRAMRTLTKPGVSRFNEVVRQSDAAMAFIRDYYRLDFETYEAARRGPPLRAGKGVA
jgi:hypothetical protein